MASGGGTNLQALIDTLKPGSPAEIVLVASENPNAKALERARGAGIETFIFEDHRDGREINSLLTESDVELLVLAGYMKLVPADVVRKFKEKILNIHPALLPAFGGEGMYGMNVHRAVIESGVTISGATVHLVDEEYDRGPVIAQWPVPVLEGDTPEVLAKRILTIEHALLPAVVLNAAKRGKVERMTFEDAAFMGTTEADPVSTLVTLKNS